MSRIAILYADGDEGWRDAAAAALAEFTHAMTPARTRSVIDPGMPALVVWTERATRRSTEIRAIVRPCLDVLLWRPDGAPAPPWAADAVPIGPEMAPRTLALMAKYAIAEGERRLRETAPRKRRLGRIALAAGAGGAAMLVIAGAAMLYATGEPRHAEVRASPPVSGLRGTQ